MKKILIPLPTYGFDPTAVTIGWKLLIATVFKIVFTTPAGELASPDSKILTGENLGIWKPALQTRKDGIIKTSVDSLLLPGDMTKALRNSWS